MKHVSQYGAMPAILARGKWGKTGFMRASSSSASGSSLAPGCLPDRRHAFTILDRIADLSQVFPAQLVDAQQVTTISPDRLRAHRLCTAAGCYRKSLPLIGHSFEARPLQIALACIKAVGALKARDQPHSANSDTVYYGDSHCRPAGSRTPRGHPGLWVAAARMSSPTSDVSVISPRSAIFSSWTSTRP